LDVHDEACPECASTDRDVFDDDEARAFEGMRLKRRNGQPGETKPHFEYFDELRWNHDRGRVERRVMVVDREHDWYRQEWLDSAGRSAFSKEGRLSDKDIHGTSARRMVSRLDQREH
jgi:hypothetical protein